MEYPGSKSGSSSVLKHTGPEVPPVPQAVLYSCWEPFLELPATAYGKAN
jgi:hypothetical protein